MSRLLVIDDEPSICWGLRQLGESMGLEVSTCASAEEGIKQAERAQPDAIVLDVRLPGMSGLEALKKLRAIVGETPILVITAYGDLSTAVKAVQNSAFEYIIKPFGLEPMKQALQRALATSATPDDQPLPEKTSGETTGEMIGDSTEMQQVFRQIALAADSELTVLLSGESGTGKELAARAIHRYGPRATGPFVAVNVAALSPSLAESELFGHTQGAFTGAEADRQGLLVQADGGTLFLDEVADIPLPVQVKLLRALECGEVLPVGGNTPKATNFRVIAASHKPLKSLVHQELFRHDLYFRLSAFEIVLPPLRDRPDDLLPLAEHFLSDLSERTSRVLVLTKETIEELKRRPWIGNVRELRNAMEHAALVARQGAIHPEHLPDPISFSLESSNEANPGDALSDSIKSWIKNRLADPNQDGTLYEELIRLIEPSLFDEVLKKHGGQYLAASKALGIHRTTLKKKLDEYGSEEKEPDERES